MVPRARMLANPITHVMRVHKRRDEQKRLRRTIRLIQLLDASLGHGGVHFFF